LLSQALEEGLTHKVIFLGLKKAWPRKRMKLVMLCISDFSTAIHCKCDCNQYQVVFDGKVMSQGGLMCSEAYVNVKITTGFGRPIGVQNRIPFNALIHI
jgi:hypothetical protein